VAVGLPVAAERSVRAGRDPAEPFIPVRRGPAEAILRRGAPAQHTRRLRMPAHRAQPHLMAAKHMQAGVAAVDTPAEVVDMPAANTSNLWSVFRIYVVPMKGLLGGFYFHPSGKDLSLGTPERKKPLGLVLPVYSNSERWISSLLGRFI
jgi:hypothetical protein